MSVAIQLVCNGCGRRTPECLLEGGVSAREAIAGERQVTAGRGWRYRRGKGDYCPACVTYADRSKEAARAKR